MHTGQLHCICLGLLLMLSLGLAACGRADSLAPQLADATATEAPTNAGRQPASPATIRRQPTEPPKPTHTPTAIGQATATPTPTNTPPPAPTATANPAPPHGANLRQLCWFTRTPDPTLDQLPSSPQPPLCAMLETGPLAPLGGIVSLFFTVLPALDAPAAEVVFELPSGIIVMHGHIQQQIRLAANVEQTVELQIQLSEAGTQRIWAWATVTEEGGGQYGSGGQLFLDVSKTKTELLPEAPTPAPSTPSTVIEATATP
jgi:hypothetical protein